MGRKREKRPPRKMKPVYIVFCEGETEEAYINFLRQTYRSPIKIITNVLGNEITPTIIQKRIKETKISLSEEISVFLLYDMDVSAINKKIEQTSAIKLLSNPCIELWFMLHFLDCSGSITTNECLQKLKQCGNEWKNYKKGILTEPQKQSLWNKRLAAVENAKALLEYENPSSTIYRLIEKLEGQK